MTTEGECECLGCIVRALIGTSQWRQMQAVRFPDDPRNKRAAKALRHLAADASGIPADRWQQLRPLFDPADQRWRDALTQYTRDVGFRAHPHSFAEFLDGLIETMAVA
jgi:hypothetical protein